jgi:hypothetical protein
LTRLSPLVLVALLALLAGCATVTLEEGRPPRVVTQWWPPYYPPVPNYPLTVTKTGTGTGTVTAPPAINCGSTCTSGYASGNVVTLTATESGGSSFSGWSGACSGTAHNCNVTMSGAQAVTASFALGGDTLPPPAPTGLSLGAPTANPSNATFATSWSISLDPPSNTAVPTYTWTASFNDTTGSSSGSVGTNALTLTMPYHATGAATAGSFCVRAVDAATNVSVGQTCSGFTVPASPAGITANWTPPTQNTDNSTLVDLTSYRVYWGASGSTPCPGSQFSSVAAPASSYRIPQLLNGQNYAVMVTALNATGTESACSSSATGAAHP